MSIRPDLVDAHASLVHQIATRFYTAAHTHPHAPALPCLVAMRHDTLLYQAAIPTSTDITNPELLEAYTLPARMLGMTRLGYGLYANVYDPATERVTRALMVLVIDGPDRITRYALPPVMDPARFDRPDAHLLLEPCQLKDTTLNPFLETLVEPDLFDMANGHDHVAPDHVAALLAPLATPGRTARLWLEQLGPDLDLPALTGLVTTGQLTAHTF